MGKLEQEADEAESYYSQILNKMNRIYLNGNMCETTTLSRAFQYDNGRLITGQELSDKIKHDINQEHLNQLSSERTMRIITAMAVAAIEFDAKEAMVEEEKERLWKEHQLKGEWTKLEDLDVAAFVAKEEKP